MDDEEEELEELDAVEGVRAVLIRIIIRIIFANRAIVKTIINIYRDDNQKQ